jgi:hypothetical protein
MTTETITIIGFVTTVLAAFGGAALGACFAYKTGMKLVKITHDNDIELFRRQEFNKAAAEFRATFVDEIFHVCRNIEETGERYLERPEEIAIANEKAKIIFEVFLPCSTLSNFNSAWDKYKNPEEINKKAYNPLNPKHRKELGNIQLSHVDNLLNFAKPKL